MYKDTIRFFDKVEDYARTRLSKHPIPYSIIGGVGVVLFWRGVWESADLLMESNVPFLAWFFYGPIQVFLATALLMLTGLMVSVFIGDRILLSGLRHEKKIEEKTEELVAEEVIRLSHIRDEIRALRKEIEELKNK